MIVKLEDVDVDWRDKKYTDEMESENPRGFFDDNGTLCGVKGCQGKAEAWAVFEAYDFPLCPGHLAAVSSENGDESDD